MIEALLARTAARKDLTDANNRRVEAAGVDIGDSRHVVLGIEQHGAEVFLLQQPHFHHE